MTIRFNFVKYFAEANDIGQSVRDSKNALLYLPRDFKLLTNHHFQG